MNAMAGVPGGDPALKPRGYVTRKSSEHPASGVVQVGQSTSESLGLWLSIASSAIPTVTIEVAPLVCGTDRNRRGLSKTAFAGPPCAVRPTVARLTP